jgi:hypothetical protein
MLLLLLMTWYGWYHCNPAEIRLSISVNSSMDIDDTQQLGGHIDDQQGPGKHSHAFLNTKLLRAISDAVNEVYFNCLTLGQRRLQRVVRVCRVEG